MVSSEPARAEHVVEKGRRVGRHRAYAVRGELAARLKAVGASCGGACRCSRSVPSLRGTFEIEVRVTSCCTTVIQKPAETLTAANAAATVLHRWFAFDQLIRETLLVSNPSVNHQEISATIA
jgi:hypothetical protein